MTTIVDTHAFLWFVAGDIRLSATARQAIEAQPGEWCISAASVWEMAIKSSLGRLSLPAPVPEYVAEKVKAGLRILSIDWPHAAGVEKMPLHHRDPFDRLIVAQAQAEGMAVITRDPIFRDYGIRIIW